MANPLRLVRVDVRDKFAPSSPTVLAVFAKVLEATSEEPRPGMQHLTIVAPLNDPAVAQCVERRILRRTMSDGTWREYRIADVVESTGPQGAQIEVTAVDPVLDLGSAEVIRDTLASGIIEFEVGLVQQTVTEIVDSEVIGRLPAEYSHFQRGTIEPTTKYDLRFTAATPLGVLEQLALAAADPVTHLPAEYQVRQTAGAFFVDVLAEIGSTQPIADVRSQKNLKANRKSRSTARMATVMLGFGADDGSGARTTIARAAWKLANPVGLVYEITDPEGGPSPVLENDQLNGMYVVPNGSGPLVQVTDSAAGNPATVTLASSSGIVAGQVYELRASASDKLVTELSSPAKAAAPPTGYGRVVGTITREDLFGARNLISNAYKRTWSNAANPPDGYSETHGAAATLTQNTDSLYTEYGDKSWKVVLTSAAGAVAVLKSPAFFPRPVNGASQFSAKVHLFLEQFTGDCWIEVRITRASSLLPPLAVAQFVPPDYPYATTSKRLAVGDFIDIGIEAADLSAAAGSALEIHVTYYNHPTSAGGVPGAITAYQDAVMCTQTPTPPPIWIEYSGSNALWHAVNLGLVNSRDPIVSYDADVLDLTRHDGTKFPYDALVGGATLRLTDRDGTVNGALLRIMAMRSINWLEEATASLTLATRQQLLADLLNRSISATSVAVSGPGGGASTPAPTPGPTPGPSPGPSPGPAPNTAKLLKTIWATRKIIEAMPAAETDVDADDGEHFLVDLTGASNVFLSGSVTDDGGLGAGELRLKYLRPSDNTWRFIDGGAGPALPVSAAGLTVGMPIFPESDAQGLRWCKVVTAGGDGASSPIVGHLALHGGVTSSSALGDWAQLIADLGGDAEVPFFYDCRFNVGLVAGKANTIDDVRGASGFGPQLGAGADGDYDASLGEISLDNGEAMVSSSTSAKADLSQPLTLVYIGTVPGTGTGLKFVCGCAALFGGAFFGVRAGTSTIAGEAFVGSTTTTIDSGVAHDAAAVRVVMVSQDGGTGLTSEVPNDGENADTLAAAFTETSNWIALGEKYNGDSANRGDCKVRAFFGVKHVLSDTEKAKILAWALVFRGAATA
jgi:hypothetical protein